MNAYELNFADFCWQNDEGRVPDASGVYCVYSCSANGSRQVVDRLLYIGHSLSLRTSLQEHTRSQDLNRQDEVGKRLFYSYATADAGLVEPCASAMVLHFHPPYNDTGTVMLASRGETQVSVMGAWAFRIRGVFVE